MNDNESAPVHFAAQEGHDEVIKTLFDNKNNPYKAELNVEDNFGKTPLHYAAAGGHADAVTILCQCDSSIVNARTKDQEGLTALEIAEKNKHYETTLALLLVPGIEMRDIPATSDISESQEYLGLTNTPVQPSVHVNTPSNQEDFTTLSFQKDTGGANLGKALLNERSDDVTNLHLTAEKGDIATLKTLIGKGVDLNIPDKAGNTVLYNATIALHKAAQNLSVRGINIDGQGRVDEPFSTVARASEVVKELITNGAKLDKKSIDFMVSNGYHDIILPSSLNYAKQNSNLQSTYFRLGRPKSELSKVQYKSDPRKQHIVQNIIAGLTKAQETVKAHILQDLAKKAGIPQAVKRHINPTIVKASPALVKKSKKSREI